MSEIEPGTTSKACVLPYAQALFLFDTDIPKLQNVNFQIKLFADTSFSAVHMWCSYLKKNYWIHKVTGLYVWNKAYIFFVKAQDLVCYVDFILALN